MNGTDNVESLLTHIDNCTLNTLSLAWGKTPVLQYASTTRYGYSCGLYVRYLDNGKCSLQPINSFDRLAARIRIDVPISAMQLLAASTLLKMDPLTRTVFLENAETKLSIK